MSEFEDQIDGCNVICPYCKSEYQPEAEDFSEDSREEECHDCGKKFYAYDSLTVDHHSRPDCELNGEQHKWEPYLFRDGRSHDYCTVCDKAASYN